MRRLAAAFLLLEGVLALAIAAVLMMYNGYVEDVGSEPAVTWPYALVVFAAGVACVVAGVRRLRR